MLSIPFVRSTVCATLLIVICSARMSWAEDMEPLGPPGSAITRMKSLNEVEPRTIITNLPYMITNSGAYYLIRNLSATANTNGITIKASNVRLDLNGFALIGKTNAHDGIYVPSVQGNLIIRNGVISGWGGDGINGLATRDSQFIDLLCSDNLQDGICAGPSSFLYHCSTHRNKWRGIITYEGSTVEECKTSGNTMHGIMAYSETRVRSCTSKDNGLDGIYAKNNCYVCDCSSTCNSNNGIEAIGGCTVVDNHCGMNGAAGIDVSGFGSRVENNNLVSNYNAIVVGGPQGHNFVVRNTSAGSVSTGFVMSVNNYFGAVVTSNAMGFSGFATNNPWANFEY